MSQTTTSSNKPQPDQIYPDIQTKEDLIERLALIERGVEFTMADPVTKAPVAPDGKPTASNCLLYTSDAADE